MRLGWWLVVFLGFVQGGQVLHGKDLEQLLQEVEGYRVEQNSENSRRLKRFAEQLEQQENLLENARQELARHSQVKQQLTLKRQQQTEELTGLQQRLKLQSQELGELSPHVYGSAELLQKAVEASPMLAQFPSRAEELKGLVQKSGQAGLTDIRTLWLLQMRQLKNGAEVSGFKAQVPGLDGVTRNQTVWRIGGFSLLTAEGFLQFDPKSKRLWLPQQQPASSGWAGQMVAGPQLLPLDPLAGKLVARAAQRPNLLQRFHQGGVVALLILAVAGAGLLLGGFCWWQLSRQRRRWDSCGSAAAAPLQELEKWAERPQVGLEQLEVQFERLLLQATASVGKGLGGVKVLAAIAPLLGLLGTVTGMIITFQALAGAGTGATQLLAGGISQALVTTVLGIMAAIPLLLLHAALSSRVERFGLMVEQRLFGVLTQAWQGEE